MSIQQIVTLLEFCLKNTYLLFQGKFYEQVHGAAMGSSISALIANLIMEEFEAKALSSCLLPVASLWMTPLSSLRQNTAKHYSNTSTTRIPTSSLQLKNHHRRAQFHCWTPWSPYNPTTPSQLQSTENQHTHRSIPTLGWQLLHHSQPKCI